MNDRHRRIGRLNRRISGDTSPVLPSRADDFAGSMNLAFQPRAGNISSDTRAGRTG
jgi:hypothetical protein